MTVHKEGYASIAIAAAVAAIITLFAYWFLMPCCPAIFYGVAIIMLGLFLFIVSFFRVPNRQLTINPNQIISPADGKVVVIEEIIDEEYFKGPCLQISVFMSPANVHQNRHPMHGEVVYNQYHKGKYLVAWHPKSSTENERWSVAVKNEHGTILYKQIAGALAKRICNYCKVGDKAEQTAEYGFIKFGSRVDVLVPIGVKPLVKLNQKVQGGVTPLATW